MPYVTPASIPESTTCRALLIPDSTDWLATFGGALTELIYSYNWEQVEGVSVEDAVQTAITVINGFYEGCVSSGCTQPGGAPIFRLNPVTWAIEELVDGAWVEPTGDYAFPPTPARSETTPEERKCLAAANAVNALSLLYESLSDSWNEALGLQEAIDAMLAILIGIVGTAFALPVAALIAIFVALMAVVYETIEFITADLWDASFSEKLTCYFYECALDDGEVVHFDIQCIINKIGSATTFDWTTELQLRLLLQVSWLMNVIGAQAIDAAGAATAITSADCDACDDVWCYEWDQTALESAWTFDFDPNGGGSVFCHIAFDADMVTHIEFDWTWNEVNGGGTSGLGIWLTDFYTDRVLDVSPLPATSGGTSTWDGTNAPATWCGLGGNQNGSEPGGEITITRILLRGTGANPFGEDNCI